MSWSGRGAKLCVAIATLSSVGCEAETPPPHWNFGVSGGSSSAGSPNAGATATSPTPEGFLQPGTPTSAPLRRLTRAEYRNLVQDALGVEPPPDYALPEDFSNAGFRSTADAPTTVAAAGRYLDAALDVGERLLPTIRELMPCSAADLGGERACIDAWLTTFGPRLFRRPMTEAERARFADTFERARQIESYEQSASLVIEALLSSPELLFVELPSGGAAGGSLALDDWQLATRISLLLWDAPPDEQLLTLAASGELKERDVLAAQVERMLAEPRARSVVRTFFDDWLGLGKIPSLAADPNGYPYLPRETTAALAEETRAYTEDVFLRRDFRELFVSGRRFRSTMLSPLYGDELGQSETVAPYEATVDERSFGLLSQAGFLMSLSRAEATSPIYRGAFVRRKLLCGRLPPADPSVVVPLPGLTPGVSKRQAITEHTSGATCAGCHATFNSFGFALEHFDIAGSWRPVTGGLPIDARVTFDEPGLRAEVDGALSLSRALADSPGARACAVQELFTFALERVPTTADQAWFDELSRHFESSGFSLRSLLAEIVLSDEFSSRIQPGARP